jgi:hypothetical protein
MQEFIIASQEGRRGDSGGRPIVLVAARPQQADTQITLRGRVGGEGACALQFCVAAASRAYARGTTIHRHHSPDQQVGTLTCHKWKRVRAAPPTPAQIQITEIPALRAACLCARPAGPCFGAHVSSVRPLALLAHSTRYVPLQPSSPIISVSASARHDKHKPKTAAAAAAAAAAFSFRQATKVRQASHYTTAPIHLETCSSLHASDELACSPHYSVTNQSPSRPAWHESLAFFATQLAICTHRIIIMLAGR